MIRIGASIAIDKHLDQLEAVLNIFMVTALIGLVASANNNKEMDILGSKIDTESAYGVASWVFDGAFLFIAQMFWKAGDLLLACDGDEVDKANTALFTHKWLFNPFSYTGHNWASNANCAIGASLFVLSWWFGLASLAVLAAKTSDGARDTTDQILLGFYILFGICSIVGICRLFGIVSDKIGNMVPSETSAFRQSVAWKSVAILLATLLGWRLYYAFANIGM